mgnify:CR=1 FL=1|tara:strand:- start:2599 stop:3048 length:450 start_codon:yes stop_codon:yes gene_type:complete
MENTRNQSPSSTEMDWTRVDQSDLPDPDLPLILDENYIQISVEDIEQLDDWNTTLSKFYDNEPVESNQLNDEDDIASQTPTPKIDKKRERYWERIKRSLEQDTELSLSKKRQKSMTKLSVSDAKFCELDPDQKIPWIQSFLGYRLKKKY